MIELKAQYRVDIIINLAKQSIPVLIVVESEDHKIISPAVANIKTEAIVFPCVRNIIIITNISDPIIATGTTKVTFGIRKLGIHQGLFPTRFKSNKKIINIELMFLFLWNYSYLLLLEQMNEVYTIPKQPIKHTYSNIE